MLVDGYATPQTVIDSLGTATMAQRVQLQDQTVHILSDRLYALQAQLTSMEAVHAAEIQEVEKRTKVGNCCRRVQTRGSSAARTCV